LWIDPRDGRHMLLGTDGGYYQGNRIKIGSLRTMA
jgi:hypothetical protein